MKRNYITRELNKIGFNFAGLTFKNIVVRESNPVDQFYFEKTVASDDGKECVAFTDPIRMLFNQERINKLGTMAVQQWLESLKNLKKDPLAELRTKCTDDDLCALIKSRHIQQPSEIMAYVEYCKNNMDVFTSEVQKLVAARQFEESKKIEQSPQVEQKTD